MSFLVESRYRSLPADFWLDATPSAAFEPSRFALNQELAAALNIPVSTLSEAELVALLSGAQVPAHLHPVALAYAGHQFGHFVPRLGDGRAILLGELLDQDGQRFELQLKGAGETGFSRNGDGRLALGPGLREVVVAEAMHKLGIPTTRALSLMRSGGKVYRQDALPGVILARVSRSHVRVGTFEFFAARGLTNRIQELADFMIEHHYPACRQAERPYFALLEAVAERQLALVADWMRVGFVHGVMNTDNTSIVGETIDYGPCAFLDEYRADQVFSSIDHGGRYRYGMQGRVLAWNLSILASCLVPILSRDRAEAVEAASAWIDDLGPRFEAAWLRAMASKIGIANPTESDRSLIEGWLAHMEAQSLDFTQTFRGLARGESMSDAELDAVWRRRLAEQGEAAEVVQERMRLANPARIPRNHRVEEAIVAAMDGDRTPFEQLMAALADPYTDDPRFSDYEASPAEDERVTQTFCGT